MTQQVVRSVILLGVLSIAISAQAGQQPASMESMMQRCREHQQAASASMDEMLTRMDEAQQSDDPARLRQAVQEAQTRMRDMRQNMPVCMEMMNQMQGMSGMMGGGMSGMMGRGTMGGMMMDCPGCAAMGGMMGGGMVAAWISGVLLVLLGLALTAALVALTPICGTAVEQRGRRSRKRPGAAALQRFSR